jgi:hypothetical protein
VIECRIRGTVLLSAKRFAQKDRHIGARERKFLQSRHREVIEPALH